MWQCTQNRPARYPSAVAHGLQGDLRRWREGKQPNGQVEEIDLPDLDFF